MYGGYDFRHSLSGGISVANMVRQGKRPLRIWSTEAGAIPQFRKNSKGKDTSNVSKNVILNLDKFTGVFMSNKERDVKNGKITIPKVLDASDHGKTTIFNGKKIGNWVTSNFEGSNSIKKSPKPIFVFEPIILAYSSSLILALAAYNGGAQWGLRYNCDRSNKSSQIKGLQGLVL